MYQLRVKKTRANPPTVTKLQLFHARDILRMFKGEAGNLKKKLYVAQEVSDPRRYYVSLKISLENDCILLLFNYSLLWFCNIKGIKVDSMACVLL